MHNLTTKPQKKVRVAYIGLNRDATHVMNDAKINFAEIIAVCDLRFDRAESMADCVAKEGRPRPTVYSGTEEIWEKMVERDDIDVVYISTPWRWHTPMVLRALERGKHAFVEVSAIVTVEDAWRIVDTSERTQRHCVMLENCCYGENELFVLNLARQGVLGELTHAECAYIHDLRGLLYDLGGEGGWRREYHKQYNGNFYPTHGLGPVAQYLGINRGDLFSHVVSMSSPEKGLSAWRAKHNPNGGKQANEQYVCGDMNTSLIKTALGRIIMIQHDVISLRLYSRINALSGTGGTFFDYPARLAINEPKAHGLDAEGSHTWLSDKDLKAMRDKFTHPLWAKLRDLAKNGGHGGMDFVMNWRHFDCIRQGITPDSVVYDAAAWSSMLELSSWSVENGSMPITVPDFTRGAWKTVPPLGVVT
ncbi:MAG TPA: Gfo/Idh/MocA family oxidoreductase [Planctomycetota bacterium]|nr:Gfo/Idh/MocA family oxidoreductase [Planctomycetota bacterium]